MRCLKLSWALIVLVMAPLTVLAGGDVSLAEIEYEDWARPEAGDPLPVGGPVIRVFSEGDDRFDFVGHTNQPVRFLGLLTGSCPRVRKISYLQFKVADTTDSVSHPDGRGAWFSRTGVVEVPHEQLQSFDAVRACNDKLKTLAAETGRSRSSLVAGGFGIHYPDWIEGRGILMCGGRNNSDSDTEKLDLWVQCVGNPEAAEPQLPTLKVIPARLAPLVADLSFEVDHPNYIGRCPVGLIFTGSITTSRKGTVKYRTVAHDGSSSPTYTLDFKSAGTKAIGKWGETLSQPSPSGTLSAGPGDDDGPDYQGWRRLEIVEPKGFAPSPPAEYNVTCQEQSLRLQGISTEPTPAPGRIRK
jgi:hypothetical protein